MIRAIVLFALTLVVPKSATAQFHDGVDDSVAARRLESQKRQRVTCRGAACPNDARGIYPQSTAPGQGARTPSMSGSFVQH